MLPGAINEKETRLKPTLSFTNIINMKCLFFGIQYSFGLQQSAVNPIYDMLGASPHEIPIEKSCRTCYRFIDTADHRGNERQNLDAKMGKEKTILFCRSHYLQSMFAGISIQQYSVDGCGFTLDT